MIHLRCVCLVKGPNRTGHGTPPFISGGHDIACGQFPQKTNGSRKYQPRGPIERVRLEGHIKAENVVSLSCWAKIHVKPV